MPRSTIFVNSKNYHYYLISFMIPFRPNPAPPFCGQKNPCFSARHAAGKHCRDFAKHVRKSAANPPFSRSAPQTANRAPLRCAPLRSAPKKRCATSRRQAAGHKKAPGPEARGQAHRVAAFLTRREVGSPFPGAKLPFGHGLNGRGHGVFLRKHDAGSGVGGGHAHQRILRFLEACVRADGHQAVARMQQ